MTDPRRNIARPLDSPAAPRALDPQAALRRGIYGILIALSIGAMIGRIFAVNSVDKIGQENEIVGRAVAQRIADAKAAGHPPDAAELQKWQQEARAKSVLQRPFLSANDRSRWDTIRALVEHGTYAIDDIVSQPSWDTIDMVEHPGRDGKPHLYSSKPPLLATLLAGEYWLIYHISGASLGQHPYEIGRAMLITINVVPLWILFWLLSRLIERWGRTDWGRIYVMAAAVLGTFLTTFAVVLNNHVTAAVTTMVAIYAAMRIWYGGRRELRYFILAGLFAALTATDELPALSLFGLLSLALVWKAPRQTLVGYVPAALVVAAAFFGTNYIAHDSLRPPYMHRSATNPADNWYDFQYMRKSDGRVIDSYWKNPAGIDKGQPSVPWYAFNVLIGHHGIFSLTPVWLLALPGIWLLGRRYGLRDLALLIGVVSVVCVTFYICFVRPLDRNYGGMTSGFRWVFWFAPLWLLAVLPAADWLSAQRWRRGLGYVLLAISVVSASYPIWNPWTYPWLTNFFLHMGWEKF
ncbi:MAG TPA: hypothetical protein VHX65_05985 [Pirellulales bacterium]|jgi:hypothetical protein|nr:hypothetical protein [Pirellulales bacterium]